MPLRTVKSRSSSSMSESTALLPFSSLPFLRYRLIAILFIFFCCQPARASQREVVVKIFDSYDRRVRPVRDETQVTKVGVRMNVINLLEVNAPQEYIKLVLYFVQCWHDDFLMWDPNDFNGTKIIRVPADSIWKPDITVITAVAAAENIKEKEEIFVGIHYDGSICSSTPIVLTNYCPMLTDNFPFDSQECTILLSSWLYPDYELLLEHSGQIPPIQNPNSVWEVFPFETETTYFFTGEANFTNLLFHQKIKRRATYYVWVIIMPTFIITTLCIAGIFAPFSNTGDREEKVTLGLTTLLTLAVVLSLVTDEVPRATNLPLLGRFVLIEIVVCAVSIAVSVCTSFLHQRATTRQWSVPKWLIRIVFWKNASQVHNKLDQLALHFEKKKCDTSTKNHKMLAGMCFWQLQETVNKLNNRLEHLEVEEERKNCWIVIFDQLDLICFFGFQLVNFLCFLLSFKDHFHAN